MCMHGAGAAHTEKEHLYIVSGSCMHIQRRSIYIIIIVSGSIVYM